VLLPKELRDQKGWSPGTLFKVEECKEGVFLRYVDKSSKLRKAVKPRKGTGGEGSERQ